MTRLFIFLSAAALLFLSPVTSSAALLWRQADVAQAPVKLQVMHPAHFAVYTADNAALALQLTGLAADPAQGIVMPLPMPDGSLRDFKVWQCPMMAGELAKKYPGIYTFTAEAVGDPRITAKLDITLFGFHAMIFDGDNTSFVDPYDRYDDGYYMVHYKRDEVHTMSERMKCAVKDDEQDSPAGAAAITVEQKAAHNAAYRTASSSSLRTYRLALSADHFYCIAATGLPSPTIAQALSAMTTTMNRVNGVYEREFSVHMNFCTHEDTLIWTAATGTVNGTDPFTSIDADGSACLTQNQTTVTSRVGTANFDLGHVFTTGGGGISSVAVVCRSTHKAESCTGQPVPVGDGFDIDFVAHEMGHEFGSKHTFNNNTDGSCGGNASANYAYEPGSGSSIMCYAGICDPDDIQPHSDAYFTASSLVQIYTALAGSENACAVVTSTGNKPVGLPAFTASYTIPYKTPFELTSPAATDSVADTANTYCWEQYNLGDFGAELINTYFRGPLFRTYNPAYTPTRIFPQISMVLAGRLSNAGVEDAEGEKAPDTARYLTFKLTVRDYINGYGCFLFPTDTVHLDAVATPAHTGFTVTSQPAGTMWYRGSAEMITWDVAGTNAAPVSCDSVDIYLSQDGGSTWPDYIGRFPNTGSAAITAPSIATTISAARIKVKGAGNVFFNVNAASFTLNSHSEGVDPQSVSANDVQVYPVPARDMVHFASKSTATLQVVIVNEEGQVIYNGTMQGSLDVAAGTWAKGIYYAQFISKEGAKIVKPVAIY